VQEVLERLRFGSIPKLFADKVLDGFHVVIGRCLYPFHALGIVDRKLIDDAIQNILHHRAERGQFRYARLIGKALQPADFYQYTISNQSIFTENIAKIIDLLGVATVGG